MSTLLKAAAIAVGGYLLLAAAAYLGQRRLMYFPHGGRVAPANVGLQGVAEREIATPDGARLVAWQAKAAPGQPTLLYFHGNAGSLALRAERLARYRARGRGMVMVSYRGYSGSTGSPSEAANVADALLAYDLLVREGVRPEDIILYGESLGTGVAVQVAAARAVRGMIMEAPFTSALDIARARYPFLPAGLLMLDRYETLRHLETVRAPVLVIHGERDGVIPLAHGRRVHAAVRGPSEIVTFPEAGHSDHHRHGSTEAVNAWIDRLAAMAVGAGG
jgi:hypothetical protein